MPAIVRQLCALVGIRHVPTHPKPSQAEPNQAKPTPTQPNKITLISLGVGAFVQNGKKDIVGRSDRRVGHAALTKNREHESGKERLEFGGDRNTYKTLLNSIRGS